MLRQIIRYVENAYVENLYEKIWQMVFLKD